MPIYEYRCNNGHTFEVFQSMSEDAVTRCEECGAPVERVFHPVAVHFKGSGFYTTDYARKGSAKAASEGGPKPDGAKADPGSKAESSSGSDSKSETKPSKSAADSGD